MAALARSSVIFRSSCLQRISNVNACQVRHFRRKDTPLPDSELWEKTLWTRRTYMERERFPKEFEVEHPKGKIYDKKPFKIFLEAEKRYSWCTCGHSKGQPFCDGSHKKLDGTTFVKTQPKYRPMRFTVEESKDYWLCNCKQSDNRPFCDGTHKQQNIQDAIKS